VGRKPTLFVIAGPNGSGKTTITRDLLDHHWATESQCIYVNPDDIVAKDSRGFNSQEAFVDAANQAEIIRNGAIREGKSLVFETVFSTESKIDFIKEAKASGYFIRFFFVCTESPKINASRIANRVMDGGHPVPIDKIISRYYRSISNAIKAIPLTDRAYFYDNSIENKQAELQFRTTGKVFQKKYQRPFPFWVKPIIETLEGVDDEVLLWLASIKNPSTQNSL